MAVERVEGVCIDTVREPVGGGLLGEPVGGELPAHQLDNEG